MERPASARPRGRARGPVLPRTIGLAAILVAFWRLLRLRFHIAHDGHPVARPWLRLFALLNGHVAPSCGLVMQPGHGEARRGAPAMLSGARHGNFSRIR